MTAENNALRYGCSGCGNLVAVAGEWCGGCDDPTAENDVPCYRARHEVEHPPHTWRNGIEFQYDVQCLGYVIPPGKVDA